MQDTVFFRLSWCAAAGLCCNRRHRDLDFFLGCEGQKLNGNQAIFMAQIKRSSFYGIRSSDLYGIRHRNQSSIQTPSGHGSSIQTPSGHGRKGTNHEQRNKCRFSCVGSSILVFGHADGRSVLVFLTYETFFQRTDTTDWRLIVKISSN
jgi:hypothetical protein